MNNCADFNCPELRLGIKFIKDALRCILHTIIFSRSIGDVGAVVPINACCEQLDIHYVKVKNDFIESEVEAKIRCFLEMLARGVTDRAQISLSFYESRPERSLLGLFSRKETEEKIYFEAWHLPVFSMDGCCAVMNQNSVKKPLLPNIYPLGGEKTAKNHFLQANKARLSASVKNSFFAALYYPLRGKSSTASPVNTLTRIPATSSVGSSQFQKELWEEHAYIASDEGCSAADIHTPYSPDITASTTITAANLGKAGDYRASSPSFRHDELKQSSYCCSLSPLDYSEELLSSSANRSGVLLNRSNTGFNHSNSSDFIDVLVSTLPHVVFPLARQALAFRNSINSMIEGYYYPRSSVGNLSHSCYFPDYYHHHHHHHRRHQLHYPHGSSQRSSRRRSNLSGFNQPHATTHTHTHNSKRDFCNASEAEDLDQTLQLLLSLQIAKKNRELLPSSLPLHRPPMQLRKRVFEGSCNRFGGECGYTVAYPQESLYEEKCEFMQSETTEVETNGDFSLKTDGLMRAEHHSIEISSCFCGEEPKDLSLEGALPYETTKTEGAKTDSLAMICLEGRNSAKSAFFPPKNEVSSREMSILSHKDSEIDCFSDKSGEEDVKYEADWRNRMGRGGVCDSCSVSSGGSCRNSSNAISNTASTTNPSATYAASTNPSTTSTATDPSTTTTYAITTATTYATTTTTPSTIIPPFTTDIYSKQQRRPHSDSNCIDILYQNTIDLQGFPATDLLFPEDEEEVSNFTKELDPPKRLPVDNVTSFDGFIDINSLVGIEGGFAAHDLEALYPEGFVLVEDKPSEAPCSTEEIPSSNLGEEALMLETGVTDDDSLGEDISRQSLAISASQASSWQEPAHHTLPPDTSFYFLVSRLVFMKENAFPHDLTAKMSVLPTQTGGGGNRRHTKRCYSPSSSRNEPVSRVFGSPFLLVEDRVNRNHLSLKFEGENTTMGLEMKSSGNAGGSFTSQCVLNKPLLLEDISAVPRCNAALSLLDEENSPSFSRFNSRSNVSFSLSSSAGFSCESLNASRGLASLKSSSPEAFQSLKNEEGVGRDETASLLSLCRSRKEGDRSSLLSLGEAPTPTEGCSSLKEASFSLAAARAENHSLLQQASCSFFYPGSLEDASHIECTGGDDWSGGIDSNPSSNYHATHEILPTFFSRKWPQSRPFLKEEVIRGSACYSAPGSNTREEEASAFSGDKAYKNVISPQTMSAAGTRASEAEDEKICALSAARKVKATSSSLGSTLPTVFRKEGSFCSSSADTELLLSKKDQFFTDGCTDVCYERRGGEGLGEGSYLEDFSSTVTKEVLLRKEADIHIRTSLLYILEKLNEMQDHLPPPSCNGSLMHRFEISFEGIGGNADWFPPSLLNSTMRNFWYLT